jgi:hypothetical protein
MVPPKSQHYCAKKAIGTHHVKLHFKTLYFHTKSNNLVGTCFCSNFYGLRKSRSIGVPQDQLKLAKIKQKTTIYKFRQPLPTLDLKEKLIFADQTLI